MAAIPNESGTGVLTSYFFGKYIRNIINLKTTFITAFNSWQERQL